MIRVVDAEYGDDGALNAASIEMTDQWFGTPTSDNQVWQLSIDDHHNIGRIRAAELVSEPEFEQVYTGYYEMRRIVTHPSVCRLDLTFDSEQAARFADCMRSYGLALDGGQFHPAAFLTDHWASIGHRLTSDVDKRALGLLRSLLTPHQRRVMKERDYIPVTGSQGGRYRVHTRGGLAFNVDTGPGWRRRLCAYPHAEIPLPDKWAAQVLTLRTDEAAFLRVANHYDGTYDA
jgi:hypothetical protein